MQYYNIGEQAFREKTFKLISKFETFEDKPYFDKFNSIAIGYGFDIVVNSYNDVNETIAHWKNVFKDASFVSEIDIEKILKSPYINDISINDALYKIHQHVKAEKNNKSKTKHSYTDNVIKKLISLNFVLASESDGKKVLNNLLYSIPDPYSKKLSDRLKEKSCTISEILNYTNEQAALLSMVYNAGKGIIGKNFSQALRDSDRFRAWCEIRYCSNSSMSFGLARRRIAESNIFGLYENHQANNLICEYKLDDIKNDMMTFTDVLHVFSNLNIKNTPYEPINYLTYISNMDYKRKYGDNTLENKYKETRYSPKDDAYYPVEKLLSPLIKYINHLFGNKYTDSQGKIIESFDLDKIFVIDTAILSANKITLQAKLHDIITYFGNNITSSSSTGNDLTPEETSLNLLIIMKGSNPSVINFNDLLRNKDFVSITLVLLKDNNCIDVSEINTENVNILSCDPNNPDKIEQIKGKIEVQQSSIENEDIDFSSDLNFSAEGYTARYKPESKTLAIYDENDNKVVELCNYIPGTIKAAIESDKFIPESELGDEQPYGSFEYKCIIEYKYNVSDIKDAPFYAFIVATQEIIQSKIQVESKNNIYAIFKFNIDSNKLANSKVVFSANKQDFQSLKDANKLAQSTGLISLAELKAGHKDGKHQLSNIFLVNHCSVKQGDKCFILEAHYSKSLDEPFYKEKAKNTKWGYIIQSGCNEIKFSNQNVNYIEKKTGSTITINYDELKPPFNKSMSINFYPYMVSPSQKVYASVRCEPLSYSVSSCEKDEKSYGIYSVRAIYQSRNTAKQTGNNSQSQFVITDKVKQNTKWIILSFKSTLSQQEIDSIRNQYLSMQTIKIEECTFNDYSVKKTTGSELKYELKNCQEWVDSIVYFYPYVYSIEKDICQSWDLRQPFYLSFTGSTLSIKSVLFSKESNNLTNTLISVTAYSGKPLEQKPENSFYKSYEVDINKKKMYFVYDKERQLLVKEGPIPERDYYLNLEDIRKMNFWGDRDHWGKYNTPLYSTPSLDNQEILLEKDTKRNNFYIHGGLEYGDEGGIDLADKDKNFFNK